jgi:hypothetical protein
MDIIRFIVLVIFIMLPFVAGLSQRFRNSNFDRPLATNGNSTSSSWQASRYTCHGYARNDTSYCQRWKSDSVCDGRGSCVYPTNCLSSSFDTRNATGFETFESSEGSFMKMFVDAGEVLPSFLTLESILLVLD